MGALSDRLKADGSSEVLFTGTAESTAAQRAVNAGRARRIARGIITPNLRDPIEIAEVHPFSDGNGRIARVFMNAELSAAGQQRIVLPTGFRHNYLGALSALTHNGRTEALIRMLDFAQQYSSRIDWASRERAQRLLDATNAFDEDPQSTLRLPEPWS